MKINNELKAIFLLTVVPQFITLTYLVVINWPTCRYPDQVIEVLVYCASFFCGIGIASTFPWKLKEKVYLMICYVTAWFIANLTITYYMTFNVFGDCI